MKEESEDDTPLKEISLMLKLFDPFNITSSK